LIGFQKSGFFSDVVIRFATVSIIEKRGLSNRRDAGGSGRNTWLYVSWIIDRYHNKGIQAKWVM
jgi:hypothetical protein